MASRSRRFVWFAAAVVAPCAALLLLGVRALWQEEAISRQRVAEGERRRVDEVRLALESAAERVRLSPAADARAAFHGVIENGRALLSWELRPTAVRMRQALADPEYLRDMRDPAGKAANWHEAPAEFLRLQEALALRRAGQSLKARALFARLALLPPTITDDQGTPIALYAIPHIAEDAARREALAQILAATVPDPHMYSPVGLRVLMTLAGEEGMKEAQQDAVRLLENAEAGARFQAAFPREVGGSSGRWLAFADPPWLIGFREGENSYAGWSASSIRLALAAQPGFSTKEGILLGEPFTGLRVILPAGGADGGPRQRPFIVGILGLALCIALSGGILFWRDLRREAQLAELRTQFVASVSHELRTPLTAIRMFTEALHDHEDINAETRKEYLATMMRENERLSRLVENILEFSRVERNQRQYQLRPVELQEIIHSVLAAVEPLIEHGGFRLEKDFASDVPPVLADRDALGQALFNLLSNAMKYSGESRSLRIGLRREGRRAVIRVSDSGAGIAPSEQRLIFDSFYRSRLPANNAIPGAGLGLTLVRHVMEGHQGEVTVSSRLGEGSTFSLALPVQGEEGKE